MRYLKMLALSLFFVQTWIISKLLWNPALDARVLQSQFLSMYYGKAAPFVGQILDLFVWESLKNNSASIMTEHTDVKTAWWVFIPWN